MRYPYQCLRSETDERSYLFEVPPKFSEAEPIPNEKLVSAESIEDWSVHLCCGLDCDGYHLGASGPTGYDVRKQRNISFEFGWTGFPCVEIEV
jgi:hypothetical protein